MATTQGTARKPISFRYVAITSEGTLTRGVIKAGSEAVAERLLLERGFGSPSLEPLPSRFSREQMFPSIFAVRPREAIIFSRQLATLLESGVSLLPALMLLQAQAGASATFKKTVGIIIEDIRTGRSFSQAIYRHREVFGDIYCRTVATGEHTGEMRSVLRQMAEYLEKQGELTKKVTKALTYPVGVLVLGIVVVLVLMTTVVPALTDMFDNLDTELPITTKILIGLGSDGNSGHQTFQAASNPA